MADVPYQLAAQVEQLQNERTNAVALGQDSRVAAVDKQLTALGVHQGATERRQTAAAADPEAQTRTPVGRSAAPKVTTATVPPVDDLDALRVQAEAAGVTVDRRWGADKLRAAIADAQKTAPRPGDKPTADATKPADGKSTDKP